MKTASQSYTLELDGVGPVLFERSKRARRISISVRPFLGVRVVVPLRVSWSRAEKFAIEKLDWIRKHRLLASTKEKEAREIISVQPFPGRAQAKQILTQKLAQLAEQHGFSFGRVRIANQQTRWGSCSGRNTISLNMQLVRLPEELQNYVLLHELVHTRFKNHGERFWRELDRYVEDSTSLRAQLREYSILPPDSEMI